MVGKQFFPKIGLRNLRGDLGRAYGAESLELLAHHSRMDKLSQGPHLIVFSLESPFQECGGAAKYKRFLALQINRFEAMFFQFMD